MFTGYKGAARRLDSIDLPKIGAQISVGEDELHAFMDVESAGTGFDAKGRVRMLFEPHVFFRELGPGKPRAAAEKKGLAYSKWKADGYPKDSYPRLLEAMKIDETAALRAASWGLGQIMGNNCRAAGYATPQAMVEAFAADEENQVAAIVAFLKAKGLDDDLRAHNWQAIERGYNGGGFKGAYAVKMAAAFAKWQRIKDTPYAPGGVTIAEVTAVPGDEPVQTTATSGGPQIIPASAAPDDRLVIKQKPIGKSRKVWFGILSAVGSGPAWLSAAFGGMDWRTVAVIAATAAGMILFFWFMYRREISAGMFGPSPDTLAKRAESTWRKDRFRELLAEGKTRKEAQAAVLEEAKGRPWENSA